MKISLYSASVPVFKQMLNALAAVLAKADKHAVDKKIAADVLPQARLYPDMFPLIRQVQIATEFARGSAARLAGVEVPVVANEEQSLADLQAHIADAIAFLDGLKAAQIDGQEEREIVLRPGTPKERKFNGHDYLVHYSLPQFFFHVTTAYAILRHNGVDVGKKDYMGA
jgi:uncharacterized protein